MTELIRILLDNAMKYTVGEPVITVEAKRNQLAIEMKQNQWRRNRSVRFSIVSPRRQFEKSYDRAVSGLGLSIAQKIAETNDVQLTAELTSETQIRFVIEGDKMDDRLIYEVLEVVWNS